MDFLPPHPSNQTWLAGKSIVFSAFETSISKFRGDFPATVDDRRSVTRQRTFQEQTTRNKCDATTKVCGVSYANSDFVKKTGDSTSNNCELRNVNDNFTTKELGFAPIKIGIELTKTVDFESQHRI